MGSPRLPVPPPQPPLGHHLLPEAGKAGALGSWWDQSSHLRSLHRSLPGGRPPTHSIEQLLWSEDFAIFIQPTKKTKKN